MLPTASSIRGNDRGYLAFHAPRYAYLLTLVAKHPVPADGRALDIGLSPLTRLLRQQLNCPVDTLGLESAPDAFDGTIGHSGRHVPFDLNRLRDPHADQPPHPLYDLIVFAEVIEHLYVSPVVVLRFLHSCLRSGGTLVVQTPNAAALGKRIKLLMGRNPFELIRDDAANPGHFREYTAGELRQFAGDSGFDVVTLSRRFYFDARFADHAQDGSTGRPQPVVGALKNAVYCALPAFLREGLTVVLRKS